MITVYGEGRGFRVVWLLEEMGLPYRLRPVDLLAGVEDDAEFLAVNPAGYIPALVDGDATLVESIAIMEYLIGRYGPTPLAPAPDDPAYPRYQQFLHLAEAGLMMPAYVRHLARVVAPTDESETWTGREMRLIYDGRLSIVTRALATSPYVAGESFTAADIAITYALEFAHRTGCRALDDATRAYVARTTARPAYARAMETCAATAGWVATLAEE